MLQKCSAVAFWQQKTETYCSWTTKMQLSCEGKLETGCLQVTFRSLWLLKRGEEGAQFIRQNSRHEENTLKLGWFLDGWYQMANAGLVMKTLWYIRWGLRIWCRENKSLRGLWWDNVKENLRLWGHTEHCRDGKDEKHLILALAHESKPLWTWTHHIPGCAGCDWFLWQPRC